MTTAQAARFLSDQRAAAARDLEPMTAGWAWRWSGWASWPISWTALVAAAVAVVVDLASAWTATPPWYLGIALLSPALPLVVLLAKLIGPERLVFDRSGLRAWYEFLYVGAFAVVLAAAAYARVGGRGNDIVGVIVTAAGEELVYRVAAVVAVGALCARLLGRDWRDTASWGAAPGFVGIVSAAVMFSVLPGHVQQMTSPQSALAFTSLGLILGYICLRTGSVVPAIVVHVLLDFTALSSLHGDLPDAPRAMLAGLALVGLVLAAMLAGRRLGLRRRVPATIDLRTLMGTSVKRAG